MSNAILRIECPDVKGLVAHVTRAIFEQDLNIVSNGEFVDPDTGRFFMRTACEGDVDADQLVAELRAKLPADAIIECVSPRPKRIAILGTKEAHCLGDILLRCDSGEWNAEILGIISNHDTLRSLVERFDHPFTHIPHTDCSREAHEAAVVAALEALDADYIVLAKYMRILSADFVDRFANRLVNIHHSFLPAFVGANPYKQAYERGVKIIGATAHFVTAELDQGPIVAQDVKHVEHHHGPRDLALAGRDIEKIVLARGLKLILEDRVFICGNKTVIFD